MRSMSPRGHLVCAHRQRLTHGWLERPSRDGLDIGQPADERAFRLRSAGDNPCGCGRVGVPARLNWRRCVHHPHHPHGRPDLYAYREASLDCLRQVESMFNRVRVGRAVATRDSRRTRLTNIYVVQAVIELALLAEAALVVTDQRRRHGTPLSLAVPPAPAMPDLVRDGRLAA